MDQIDFDINGKYNGFTFIFFNGFWTYSKMYNYSGYDLAHNKFYKKTIYKNNFLMNLSKISQLTILLNMYFLICAIKIN